MRKCANFFRYMTIHPIPLNFLIYEENFILFFISAVFPSCYDGKCATQRSQYLLCRIRGKKRELLDALNRTHTPFSKLLTGGINFRFWPIFCRVLYVLCTSKTSTLEYVPLVKGMSRATSLHKGNNVLDRFRFQKKGIDQFSQVFV
jgi:hypothetical protein